MVLHLSVIGKNQVEIRTSYSNTNFKARSYKKGSEDVVKEYDTRYWGFVMGIFDPHAISSFSTPGTRLDMF